MSIAAAAKTEGRQLVRKGCQEMLSHILDVVCRISLGRSLRFLHQDRMSVRQRLRITFEARRIDRLCWRCALGLGNGPTDTLTAVKNVLPASGGPRSGAQRTGRRIYDGPVSHRSLTGQAGLVKSWQLRSKSLGTPSQKNRRYATAAVSLARRNFLYMS